VYLSDDSVRRLERLSWPNKLTEGRHNWRTNVALGICARFLDFHGGRDGNSLSAVVFEVRTPLLTNTVMFCDYLVLKAQVAFMKCMDYSEQPSLFCVPRLIYSQWSNWIYYYPSSPLRLLDILNGPDAYKAVGLAKWLVLLLFFLVAAGKYILFSRSLRRAVLSVTMSMPRDAIGMMTMLS